jgi:hypothetical protein
MTREPLHVPLQTYGGMKRVNYEVLKLHGCKSFMPFTIAQNLTLAAAPRQQPPEPILSYLANLNLPIETI